MKCLCTCLVALFISVAPALALADDVADQRARLANQRIQLEEERRAREEAEAQSDELSEPASPDSEDVATDASTERMEMSRALEQLRELGALRDAGYVTEQEFEQLKKKILDAAL